jgi:tRNA-dihydrouridine synthase B
MGLRMARKHLGWFMDTAGTQAELRRKILTEKDASEVMKMIPEAMEGGAE